MLSLQRFGVTIDQCTGCGGIFLDRGELEQLAEAEAKFYAAPQPPAQPYNPPPPQYQGQAPVYYERPRQGGFLGGLFDGGRHGGSHHGGHH
jgi:hypothetical protein